LAAANTYNTNNFEVKRSCRRDKKRIDEIVHVAEVAVEQRDVKEVYDTTRVLSG